MERPLTIACHIEKKVYPASLGLFVIKAFESLCQYQRQLQTCHHLN